MKAKHIFSLLLLIVCLLIPFEPVSRWVVESSTPIYQTQPCIRWGNWTVGQSSGSGNTVVTTFITNSEKTVCVKADVKYCASQPSAYVYPIQSFDFEITVNNGFTVRKQVETTSGPAASQFSPNTAFSVEAMLEVPADMARVRSCDGLNGRSSNAMAVTIKFKGYYGWDAANLKTVTLTKTWTQDSIDMLRQEYVDMTPPDGRAELPVPGRGQFKWEISSNGVDDWNTGHYNYMIDDGLPLKKAAWLTEVNSYRKANSLSVFTDKQFKVNSAYRNPYHQRFHVNAPYDTASFHSRHCYGDALDIETLDVDGDSKDGTVEQVVGNKAQSDDGELMALRADDAGALWTASWEYYSTHTHADWTLRRSDGGSWPPAVGTVYSPPCEMPDDTTTPSTNPGNGNSGNGNSGNSETLHACGVHLSTVSGDHSYGKLTCGAHSDYKCLELQKDRTYISSCTETNSSGNTCNNSSGYYECKPHTHTYASGGLVSCKRKHCDIMLSSAYGHSVICKGCGHRYWTCPTAAGRKHHVWVASCQSRSNGNPCTNGSGYYKCSPHSHTYPSSNNNNGNPTPLPPPPPSSVSCGRSACTASVSSANEHRVGPCSGCSSSYWTCGPYAVYSANLHRVRTCRRSGCGNTWQRCLSSTPSCLVASGKGCWAQ